MFNGPLDFHKRAIREIKEDFKSLQSRFGNLFFNKISIEEAEFRFESATSKLESWLRQTEYMDPSLKDKLFKKYRRDIDEIDTLCLKIEKKIEKKRKRKNKIIGETINKPISSPRFKNSENLPSSKKIPKKPMTIKNPEGIVYNFRQEMEVHRSYLNTIRKVHARIWDPIFGRLDPPTKKGIFLWKFDLHLSDPDYILNIPVLMRGGRLKGQVGDGDQIAIDGKWKWTPGEIIEVNYCYNMTREKKVKVTGGAVPLY